jgi:RNA polymerase sigma factor (sigma-70 family)
MIDKFAGNCGQHNASDEELVKLFLESQDNRYFEKLYERYAVKVYQKCVSLTRDTSRAEDLVHDVFLKLMFKMSTFKEDAKFSTWLFSITYNHCMDLMRSGKRKIVTVYEENIELEDDKDLLTIFDIEEIDTRSLKAALSHLNLEEKAMIYLKYLDNKSIRDIARIFEITESAVKMRLMRSREKLRKNYLEFFLFG